ncbi:Lipase member h-a [Gryllus bimaculatus]|nr:Lipase member h-a [Gryllus bimaculatus]
MPLFVTSNLDEKLDASDAHFVDVVHTNALAQGKVEQCGHIDFYMNGGITQPGCYGESGCNHHRSLAYFAESVRSEAGFWGWPCGGVMHYILGLCPPRGTPWKMGEDVDQRISNNRRIEEMDVHWFLIPNNVYTT